MSRFAAPLAVLFAAAVLALWRTDRASAPTPCAEVAPSVDEAASGRLIGMPVVGVATADAANGTRPAAVEAAAAGASVGAGERKRGGLSPEQVSASLDAHVTLVLGTASIETMRASEARVRENLAALDAAHVVALLRKARTPAALDFLVRWVDLRLHEGRASFEDALLMGMEEADTDLTGLAVLAEVAVTRMEGPAARRAAAGFLRKRATTDRVRQVLERFERP